MVVTGAVFALLWTTRPQVENEMVAVARSRQNLPLVEVDRPARLDRTIEEERRQQAEDLYPYLQARLLEDQQLDDHVRALVSTMISQQVANAMAGSVDGAISRATDALRTQLEQEISRKGDVTAEQLHAAVDALIPRIVPIVVEEWNTNKDAYLADIRTGLEPAMRDEAAQVLDAQRDAIVTEAVERVLDRIEREDAPAVVVEAPVAEPEETPVEPEPAPVETPEPIAAEPAPVAVEEAPAVEPVPAESVTEPVPEPAAPSRIITPPVFEVHAQPTVLDAAAYEQQREEIRKQKIQEVLDLLDAGKR